MTVVAKNEQAIRRLCMGEGLLREQILSTELLSALRLVHAAGSVACDGATVGCLAEGFLSAQQLRHTGVDLQELGAQEVTHLFAAARQRPRMG